MDCNANIITNAAEQANQQSKLNQQSTLKPHGCKSQNSCCCVFGLLSPNCPAFPSSTINVVTCSGDVACCNKSRHGANWLCLLSIINPRECSFSSSLNGRRKEQFYRRRGGAMNAYEGSADVTAVEAQGCGRCEKTFYGRTGRALT